MMKHIIYSSFVFLILLFNFSFTDNSKDLLLVNGNEISMYVSSKEQFNLFQSIEYSYEYDFILIESKKEINYIQILGSDNEVKEAIKISSQFAQIGKSLFQKGKYKLAFKFKNVDKVEYFNLLRS